MVGLSGVQGDPVDSNSAAGQAAMDHLKATAALILHSDWLHYAPTGLGTVSGNDVHVRRVETFRALVPVAAV